MARQHFIEQLKELGYAVDERGSEQVAIAYTIPVGRFAKKTIRLGFKVGNDFPANPPSGPHVSPHLLPINNKDKTYPLGGIHDSPFGPDWQYWSRPYNGWNQTDRTARTYLAHIRRLFLDLS